ncbi:sulfotransferase [Massilia sp. W12]|uniref:sulfotransferase family protein n=1 Tax=Massilia sp. W12 TaxID=3126507 RepID=UPI0030CC91C5
MHNDFPQVFVVGTGRCGSTLLSQMLNLHPQILSLSECFSFLSDLGCLLEQCFPEGELDGAALWRILGAQRPRLNAMLQHRVEMAEVLYRVDAAGRAYGRDGVPALLQTCLPHLCASAPEPDLAAQEWYARLQAFCLALPAAPIGAQYQRVFAWLAQQMQRRIWVERSGGGLRIIGRLLQHFPNARFVHILRDGPDTALSMSRHRGFRMAFGVYQLIEVLGHDPWENADRSWEGDLSDEQAALLPENFSAQALHAFDAPAPLCGLYWSGEIMQGLPHLLALPPQRCLHLRYEDLLSQPAQSLAALYDFISGPQQALDAALRHTWLQQAQSLIAKPSSDWRSLAPRLREQTAHACAPGMQALRAAQFY